MVDAQVYSYVKTHQTLQFKGCILLYINFASITMVVSKGKQPPWSSINYITIFSLFHDIYQYIKLFHSFLYMSIPQLPPPIRTETL